MNSSSVDLLVLGVHKVLFSKAAISVSAILNLPLNAYVMFLIISRASKAPDIFSLNLAVSETLYSLLSLTLFGVVETSLYGLLSLEILLFSGGLVLTARPLFQCCICVEYYIGVVHPVFFLRCRPLRYRAACCGVLWLITLVACLSTKYILSVPVYRYVFFIQNVLLGSVMVFCCMSVLWALKQPGPGEGNPERRGGDAVKRRAFNIILLIMISTFVSMLLYVAVIPLQCCLSQQGFNSALAVTNNLALCTAFIQPLLYLQRAAKLDCCRRSREYKKPTCPAQKSLSRLQMCRD